MQVGCSHKKVGECSKRLPESWSKHFCKPYVVFTQVERLRLWLKGVMCILQTEISTLFMSFRSVLEELKQGMAPQDKGLSDKSLVTGPSGLPQKNSHELGSSGSEEREFRSSTSSDSEGRSMAMLLNT